MKLYLAGSFPHLTNLKNERKLKESIESRGKTYNRLVSFFYPATIKTVLTLQEEERNGKITNPTRLRKSPRQRRENVTISDEKIQVDESDKVQRGCDIQGRAKEGVSRKRNSSR